MAKILSNKGRIVFADCAHVNSSPKGLTDARAKEYGSKVPLITVNKGGAKLQGKEDIIRAAGGEIGDYTKTAQEQKDVAIHFDPAWISRCLGGQKIREITRWNVLLTQPDSPWRAYHLQDLLNTFANDNYAVWNFSDSAALYSYSASCNPAVPPQYRVEYTPQAWLKLLDNNLRYWMQGTPHIKWSINGLNKDTVDVFPPTVGMLEGAFHAGRGTLPNLKAFEETANFIMYAQTVKWTPWVYIKLPNESFFSKWRNFMAPAMLIMDGGRLIYTLGLPEGQPPMWYTQEYNQAIYNHDIGLPLDTFHTLKEYTISAGVYRRKFVNADVYLNVNTRQFVDGKIKVPAQSGIIV